MRQLPENLAKESADGIQLKKAGKLIWGGKKPDYLNRFCMGRLEGTQKARAGEESRYDEEDLSHYAPPNLSGGVSSPAWVNGSYSLLFFHGDASFLLGGKLLSSFRSGLGLLKVWRGEGKMREKRKRGS